MMNDNSLIILHDNNCLERQKIAGKCVADVLRQCSFLFKNPKDNINLKDVEVLADEIIKKHNCTPTFYNYKGFPSKLCLSTNKELVHGVVKDYYLKPGDLISVDLGATYENAIADAAFTYVFGGIELVSKQVQDMLKLCKSALNESIKCVKPGNRIGKIGYTIYNHVKNSSYGLIDKYGGHGIDCINAKPHAEPFVSNKDKENSGVMIQDGMSLAIEPMLTLNKDTATRTLNDGWTVLTNNLSCHFEHTLFVEKDKTHIITEHGLDI